ncbi:hypothetical protein [Bradyrhizobium sp. Gha]|uniref:hypothetical protein n=1 Tax=Bradyrhizobium sp. Gha TaxID=1855318 RepID=UPI000B0C8AF8|nr:hypothetical protein [Bradyrhizobium sp. Gha]
MCDGNAECQPSFVGGFVAPTIASQSCRCFTRIGDELSHWFRTRTADAGKRPSAAHRRAVEKERDRLANALAESEREKKAAAELAEALLVSEEHKIAAATEKKSRS